MLRPITTSACGWRPASFFSVSKRKSGSLPPSEPAYRGHIDGIIDEKESAGELPRLRAEKKRPPDERAALDEPPSWSCCARPP